jgi:hypothetical protein
MRVGSTEPLEAFENGKMRLMNPTTKRAGGVTHLIHPEPKDGGPYPACRPGYKNMINRAAPVPDDSPVTCRLCLAGTTGEHKSGVKQH